MTNLKPLIDAVAFVKANPDKYDQNQDYFNLPARCIISYAASKIGQHEDRQYPDVADLADKMGVTLEEINNIYNGYNNEEAINLAKALIAKYAPVKYPVGTVLRSLAGNLYTVTDVASDGTVTFKSNNTGSEFVYAAEQMESWNPIIVEDEMSSPNFEYVLTGESPWGVWLTLKNFANLEEAKREAAKISYGLHGDFTVKLEKVYMAPVTERIDF